MSVLEQKFSVPVKVVVSDTYAQFNEDSPVSIPTDKTDHNEPQPCPVCEEFADMGKSFTTEEGIRFSGICGNCNARWHRFMFGDRHEIYIYSKTLEQGTALISPFVPEKDPPAGLADSPWLVTLEILYGLDDEAEKYHKSWSCTAATLSKTRRLARMRIRKESKAKGFPFSIKDALVEQDEDHQVLSIGIEAYELS